MELKTIFAQDLTGKVKAQAQATLYFRGTSTLATGLTDVDGNPMTNPFFSDNLGKILIKAPSAEYDLYFENGISAAIQFLDVTEQVTTATSAASAAATSAASAANTLATAAKITDLAAPTGNAMIGVFPQGTLAQAMRGVITPEMFGALGDGTTDDLGAIQGALNYLINNPQNVLSGNGNYALSGTAYLYGYSLGMRVFLRSVVAHANFPAPTKWQEGTPLFMCGHPSSQGAPVGLNFTVDYADGKSKADFMHWAYYGVGGSTFNLNFLNNMNNGVLQTHSSWPMSSNRVNGNYWNTGNGNAFRLGRTPEYPSNSTCEATVIDVNFIIGYKRGAIYIRSGAMYTNVRGQSDFNGKWVQKIYTNGLTGAVSGNTITYNGTNYTVVAHTANVSGETGLLIDCIQDVSTTALIPVGATITYNGNSFTVGSIKLPSVGSWYPDVIHDFYDSDGISKCDISMPYCGGIEGTFLFASKFHIGNANVAYMDQITGISFTHSGAVSTITDLVNNKEILSGAASYVYPGQHFYMRRYRIQGIEIYGPVDSGSTSNIATFAHWGDSTVSQVREVWNATLSGLQSGTDVYGKYMIYVKDASIQVIPIVQDGIINVSVSGMTVTATQSSGVQIVTVWNIVRDI